ncbi:PREDICTED: pescadillo homolog [Nicrophorus vespilloides]|uniref:Pescadillo homolog n=1 Tax=Nicrophorus vespilloides TaxID=110193 RepID=A0ABM1NK40_NICVS|nr:PREDICTED: pescadillo homolog [Nicrophorus vespilloides]
MAGPRKKKFESGEGATYISRRKAIRKLQVSMNTFRTLCILKGIYPREPRNRKRAQKGDMTIKTLYHVKDIQFLMNEPNIWRLRSMRVISKKVAKARAIRDKETVGRLLDKFPKVELDHIVKERYPTFIDALRDLDDCLTLCFLFSSFPSMKHLPKDQSAMCRRLTTEFLHAIIESKSLRKVFVSIKGYYFQAEIKGQTITWIVPHQYGFEPQQRSEVDFKLMSTFVDFYIVLLGFVNFRLYSGLNLFYPPKFSCIEDQSEEDKKLVDEQVFISERVAALNFPLSKTSTATEEDDVNLDEFTDIDNPEKMEEIRKEAEAVKGLKSLFKGLKFFLNREVPRENLVFMIRCFGGEVSWDKTLFVGSTYNEDDESITHQIVDRPMKDKQYISRYYIQPQWIFDSVNARQLLPVNKYFIGAVLPPHLSPFVDKFREDSYVPPEEKALYDSELLEKMHNEINSEDEAEISDAAISDNEDEADLNEDSEEEDEYPDDVIMEDGYKSEEPKKSKLSVKAGEVTKEKPYSKLKEDRADYKLREKMIKGKYRKIYNDMMITKRTKSKEALLLKKKRSQLDKQAVEDKKQKKKTKTSK